ncbi:MAG: hypothetical protein P8X74_22450 [Reinekea sp.]
MNPQVPTSMPEMMGEPGRDGRPYTGQRCEHDLTVDRSGRAGTFGVVEPLMSH